MHPSTIAPVHLARLADLRSHYSPIDHVVAVRAYGPTVMPLRLALAADLPIIHYGRAA